MSDNTENQESIIGAIIRITWEWFTKSDPIEPDYGYSNEPSGETDYYGHAAERTARQRKLGLKLADDE